MKRRSIIHLAMAMGMAGMCTAASAQSYSDDQPVTVDPPIYGYAPLTIEKPAAAYRDRTSVYGYTQYYQVPASPPLVSRTERSVAGGCGEFRYWNGERCVDARNKRSSP